MRKIKRFKLAVRHKEVARRARKARLPLADLGLAEEEALAARVAALAEGVEPAVAYDSFGAQDAAAGLAPLPGLGFSLGLATLGARFAEAVLAQPEGPARDLARLVGRVALDQACAFATSLLADEAEAEKCDLSPLRTLDDPAALSDLADRLDASKVGVRLGDGGLEPAFSSAFSVSWIAKPRSKSRR